MSSAGDAATTPSAQTGLSYTSGPGRWVLLVTVLGSAVASIDATVVGIALPAIGRDFGASLTTLQWVVTAYTLAIERLGCTRARLDLARAHLLYRGPSRSSMAPR